LDRRPAGPENRSGRGGKEKNSWSCRESNAGRCRSVRNQSLMNQATQVCVCARATVTQWNMTNIKNWLESGAAATGTYFPFIVRLIKWGALRLVGRTVHWLIQALFLIALLLTLRLFRGPNVTEIRVHRTLQANACLCFRLELQCSKFKHFSTVCEKLWFITDNIHCLSWLYTCLMDNALHNCNTINQPLSQPFASLFSLRIRPSGLFRFRINFWNYEWI